MPVGMLVLEEVVGVPVLVVLGHVEVGAYTEQGSCDYGERTEMTLSHRPRQDGTDERRYREG